jgi:hypothetical protein
VEACKSSSPAIGCGRSTPDIVEYLDSGKIGARSVAGERILLSRPGPVLDYWDGED